MGERHDRSANVFLKLKMWLAGAGALVLAIAVTALTFWLKGRKAGEAHAQVEKAQEVAQGAKEAQATYQDASEAAKTVATKAATEPKPDVVKRDDLNNTF